MALLHSKILGDGEPLVILHGFLGMSDNWKTLGNFYSKNGFRVHLIDQRNHGRSFHANEFSYDLLSNDLDFYLNHHQIEQTNIIGHSMGGKTAMFFASYYPERIQKLLVADIAPKQYPIHHQDILNGLHSVILENVTSRKDAEEQLSLHIKEAGIRQFLLKNLYRKTKDTFGWRMNLPVLTENIDKIGAVTPQDKKFNGDTLFLKGANSNYILPEDHKQISALFTRSKIASISNAGHWLHAENPEEFAKVSLNFMEN